MSASSRLAELAGPESPYRAILDESAKREVRRAVLTAVCVPGYQVPFPSREMPVARGWGSGGLQVTAALVGEGDVVKVIDQGDDAGVNAANLRGLIARTAPIGTTLATAEATIVQTRHRVPDDPMQAGQILVLQVPIPEPLRPVERRESEQRRMHAEADYAPMWVSLYEDIVRSGVVTQTTGYPCLVDGRYVIATTPIPRWDCPKLHRAPFLSLFGAGREQRVYAIPPHTDVEPLTFDDVPFEVERVDARCLRCGASGLDVAFLVEVPSVDGERWACSDTAACERRAGIALAARRAEDASAEQRP